MSKDVKREKDYTEEPCPACKIAEKLNSPVCVLCKKPNKRFKKSNESNNKRFRKIKRERVPTEDSDSSEEICQVCLPSFDNDSIEKCPSCGRTNRNYDPDYKHEPIQHKPLQPEPLQPEPHDDGCSCNNCTIL